MKQFIKANIKTIILIIIFLILFILTILKNTNNEETKENTEVNQMISVEEENTKDTKKMNIIHIKSSVDKNNNKTFLVFNKTLTDIEDKYNYYIQMENKNIDVDKFINDEHSLVLFTKSIIDKDFKVIIEDKTNKEKREIIIKQQIIDYIDLSNITKEKYETHQKLEHHLLSIEAKLKLLSKDIENQENLLIFTQEKIKDFTTNNDRENIERFTKTKEEIENKLDELKKEKEQHQKQQEELKNQNQALEDLFNKILGNLHHH